MLALVIIVGISAILYAALLGMTKVLHEESQAEIRQITLNLELAESKLTSILHAMKKQQERMAKSIQELQSTINDKADNVGTTSN